MLSLVIHFRYSIHILWFSLNSLVYNQSIQLQLRKSFKKISPDDEPTGRHRLGENETRLTNLASTAVIP